METLKKLSWTTIITSSNARHCWIDEGCLNKLLQKSAFQIYEAGLVEFSETPISAHPETLQPVVLISNQVGKNENKVKSV